MNVNYCKKWKENDIKNLYDLFIIYKMSIEEISDILNRTELDIKNKLIEFKIVNPKTHIFIENYNTTYSKHINLLHHIKNDIEKRIRKRLVNSQS